jgi:hypothetical protein
MRTVTFILAVLILPAEAEAEAAAKAEAASRSVSCTDPATGEKGSVRVGSIKSGLDRVRRTMKRYGVHILDLPESVRERHAHLDEFRAEKNWCVLNSHYQDIETALEMMRIDQSFVSEKFARVERWMRDGFESSRPQAQAERRLANAAAQMADGRFENANRTLNKVMAQLFGSDDTWKLPAQLPEGDDAGGGAVRAPAIDTREVEAGCPAFAQRGDATSAELDTTLANLRKLMDQRVLRPLDLKGGEELVADLESYTKLRAIWPATRIACAMLHRIRSLEVDLGVVQKRFQRVKNLKERRGIEPASEKRFKELVRNASRKIMAREYSAAHEELEELLVFLGEPSPPSASLP